MAATVAGFVVLAMPDAALGVAWPSMRADLDQPLPALGVLLAVLTAGYLLASVATGPLAARVGGGVLLAAAGLAGAIALGAYAVAPAWSVVLAAAALLGVSGGLLDAGLNAHSALHHGAPALNLLHAGFGVGSTIGPLLMTGILVVGGSWRSAFAVLAVVDLALGVAYWRKRRAWATDGLAGASEDDEPTAPPGSTRRWPVVIGAITFFVYVGIEVSAAQWAYSLFTEERGFSEGSAGTWVALYWAALTVGRLAAAAAGRRVAPDALLTVAVAGAALGAAVLWLAPVPALGPLGLALLGLALAPVFPTLVAVTPARVGAARTASAVGLQVAAGGLGGGLLPLSVGLVMDRAGLEALGPLLLGGAVAMGLLDLAGRRGPAPSLAG